MPEGDFSLCRLPVPASEVGVRPQTPNLFPGQRSPCGDQRETKGWVHFCYGVMMMGMYRALLVAVLMIGLLSVSWAGDLKCHVSRAGVDVVGAQVTVNPGAHVRLSGPGGIVVFPGLAAGNYRVTAEKTILAQLNGAVLDEVAIPAAGGVSVELKLTRAVRVNEYMPLRLGNLWQYREVIETAPGMVTSRTRREEVVGTTPISGTMTSVVLITYTPGPDTFRMYMHSSGLGFGVYGETRGAETLTYVPPLLIPSLCPQGHTRVVKGVVKHSGGAPDDPMKMLATFAAFEDVTVPAGVFPNCIRLDLTLETAGVASKLTLWMARGVGQVRVMESKPGKTVRRSLAMYRLGPVPVHPLPAP
jgi:hypothetical protein